MSYSQSGFCVKKAKKPKKCAILPLKKNFLNRVANSTKNITPADRLHKKQHIVFCGLAVVNTTYFDNRGEIYGTKGKYAAGDY